MRRREINYQVLVGYLLLFSGSLISIWLVLSLIKGIQTYWWADSVAIIYESKVLYTTSNPLDKKKTLHTVLINYRYQIEGKTHTNTQIYRTDIPLLGFDQAGQLIDKFPTGSIQPVYYDAQFPEDSVLIQGVSATLLLLLAPVFLFLVIGLRATSLLKKRPS